MSLVTIGIISVQDQVVLSKATRDTSNLRVGNINREKTILVSHIKRTGDPVAELAGSAHAIYKKYEGADAIIRKNQHDWES